MLQAGFAEVDITPPLGTQKIGWIKKIIADRIADPLYARAAVFEADGERAAFVQLDLLCLPAALVAQTRRRIQSATGFAGADVMVAATHTHAGPAVDSLGDAVRDEAYVQTLLGKLESVFAAALAALAPAEAGLGSCFEFAVAHNRRVVMRDGTVRTHGSFKDPDALVLEGPTDPEVAVLAVRAPGGALLGALVNYACHPCHYGGDTVISAGFPGVLAKLMKSRGCAVTMFLNGAAGNQHTADPARGTDMPMDQAGGILADDVSGVLAKMVFRPAVKLASRSKVIQLPYRRPTEDQVAGKAVGAQRFVDPSAYDRDMPALLEEIRRQKTQPAEVQVIALDDWAFVSLPGECFAEIGLDIKQRCHPRRAVVVANANGMVGYVPHRAAFARGGYETTFCPWSKLAPEAGDLLADAAVELVGRGP